MRKKIPDESAHKTSMILIKSQQLVQFQFRLGLLFEY